MFAFACGPLPVEGGSQHFPECFSARGTMVQRKVFNSDQSSYPACWHNLSAMKKELSSKQILALPCPTCGAAPGEKCELGSGQPRTEPHRDRRLIAAD